MAFSHPFRMQSTLGTVPGVSPARETLATFLSPFQGEDQIFIFLKAIA